VPLRNIAPPGHSFCCCCLRRTGARQIPYTSGAGLGSSFEQPLTGNARTLVTAADLSASRRGRIGASTTVRLSRSTSRRRSGTPCQQIATVRLRLQYVLTVAEVHRAACSSRRTRRYTGLIRATRLSEGPQAASPLIAQHELSTQIWQIPDRPQDWKIHRCFIYLDPDYAGKGHGALSLARQEISASQLIYGRNYKC
jgi:hypothetical protein